MKLAMLKIPNHSITVQANFIEVKTTHCIILMSLYYVTTGELEEWRKRIRPCVSWLKPAQLLFNTIFYFLHFSFNYFIFRTWVASGTLEWLEKAIKLIFCNRKSCSCHASKGILRMSYHPESLSQSQWTTAFWNFFFRHVCLREVLLILMEFLFRHFDLISEHV